MASRFSKTIYTTNRKVSILNILYNMNELLQLSLALLVAGVALVWADEQSYESSVELYVRQDSNISYVSDFHYEFLSILLFKMM